MLLTLLVAAAAAWAFVELTDEVLEGETHAFDRALLLALRDAADPSDPLGPAWFEEMVRDFTALGSTGVLTFALLVTAGYLLLVGRRAMAVTVVLSVGAGQLVSSLLKLGFDRPRPDLVPHAMEVYTASFPSGHSTMAAVVYLTLGALLARTQPRARARVYILSVAVLLTLLIGASRVYLGVHWPTDVLAGWSVGAAWAMVCWLLMLWLQRRGAVEATPGEEFGPQDRSSRRY
ncbi:MAG TPA: phosphatase PAP2 family protein [Pelomicrobium sp.]|nr:phosphatase PAP2 family protein [Pelomicrobium sp.]